MAIVLSEEGSLEVACEEDIKKKKGKVYAEFEHVLFGECG